jgi:hypothetical protein
MKYVAGLVQWVVSVMLAARGSGSCQSRIFGTLKSWTLACLDLRQKRSVLASMHDLIIRDLLLGRGGFGSICMQFGNVETTLLRDPSNP